MRICVSRVTCPPHLFSFTKHNLKFKILQNAITHLKRSKRSTYSRIASKTSQNNASEIKKKLNLAMVRKLEPAMAKAAQHVQFRELDEAEKELLTVLFSNFLTK